VEKPLVQRPTLAAAPGVGAPSHVTAPIPGAPWSGRSQHCNTVERSCLSRDGCPGAMVRLPPLLVLLVLLALFLPPQQAGDPKRPQRPQQRYGAPPPPATQPAALPKLELGPANCVDMFGAGVSGGGTNGSGALFDEQEAAGDPSRAQGASILKSTYMPGWTLWM